MTKCDRGKGALTALMTVKVCRWQLLLEYAGEQRGLFDRELPGLTALRYGD